MNVMVTGSIAYDYLMRFPGRFAEHLIGEKLHQVSLSFLVEDMTKHWGGVAANIAYSMALLGMRPQLMGTVGRDFGDYRDWLERAGVDTSTVRQIDEVFTASFFVNTDLDNNQIASFYSGAMAQARHYRIREVSSVQPDLVLISPNDPIAMSNYAEECRQQGIRFIYDPSQQVPRLDGDTLCRDMNGAYAMIVNAYEAEIISKKTGQTLADLRRVLDILVITQGKDGADVYLNGDQMHVSAYPLPRVIDPTGGGDAFRAGFVRGLAAGWPIHTCAEAGSLVAAYALEHVGTQNHRFTPQEFVTRFRAFYQDEGLLDTLVTVS